MGDQLLRRFALILLVSLLPWLPAAPAIAAQTQLAYQAPDQLQPDQPAEPPAELVAAAEPDRKLPSLVMRLQVTPASARVGETITARLTIRNQAGHPAEDLSVTLALPDGVLAKSGDSAFQQQGWRWALGSLAGQAETVLNVTMQLARRPAGDALVLRPAVIARGLDLPIVATGGALVDRDAPRPGATASERDQSLAQFSPGSAARLSSADGRISVAFASNGFDRPLQLRHTSAKQASLPADHRRGFAAFRLEAFDAQQQAVHQFAAPVTISATFTPQQLAALNLSADTLSLFWLDETHGTWVPIPTLVDAAQGRATATVNHFSTFKFADGSSPSAAFIPSLQGWQVSGFTGAANYALPLDLPSGPGGIKPSLELSYSSAANDGAGGKRAMQQSSWVGKGWSLDTGAIARNKIEISNGTTVEHFAVSFGGRSFDLIRAEALVGSPDGTNPTHWAWRATDENFTRARVYTNGTSTSTRGGYEGSSPYTRHKWVVWDKDGTRYEFADDAWWGWDICSGGSGDFAYMETYKWLLTNVRDTRGNVITYNYNRQATSYANTCFQVRGTIDVDVWPSSISWANGRYQVTFDTEARTNDTQVEWPAGTYGEPPRQTQRLKAIKVWSYPSGAAQLMRQYNLTHDYSLYSDERVCYYEPDCASWGANTSYPKLTLKSFQRLGNNGSTALPATTFSYNTSGGTAQRAAGGWNRLTGMNNGQGGTISLAYDNISVAINNQLYDNHHRVKTRTIGDGRSNSYTWNYSYGTAAVNFLGTNLGDGLSTGPHPNSAVLFYNKYSDPYHNYEDWLVHRIWKEFRGHSWMQETAPDGAQTKHYYYQGDVGCTPAARDGDAAVKADPCFIQMRDREFLKGREYKTEVRGPTSAGSPLLADTSKSFAVAFYDYTWAPLSGLWRAFSYESQTIDTQYEGSVASPHRTDYFYNDACTAGVVAAYGNLGCIVEYDQTGAFVRKILRNYAVRNDDPLTNQNASYLVDRLWGERVYDVSGNLLSLVHYFYDSTGNVGTVGTRGEMRMQRRYYNIPTGPCCSGVTLYGRDVVYEYDSYGNRIRELTYTGPGNTVVTTTSAPGNGSAYRETYYYYDDTATSGVDEATSGLVRRVTYPVLQPNSYRLTEQASYDYRMGTLTGVTDLSGVTTQAEYDVFGRMVKLIKPGDSSSYPTLQAYYYDSEQPFRYRFDQREQAGTTNVRVSVKLYDGLGQLIQTKQESNGTSQTIVSDTRFDGLGRVRQQSQPRYVAETSSTYDRYTSVPSSGVNWTTSAYDALGRVASVTQPDGNQVTHRYGIVNDSTKLRWHDTVDQNRHRMQYRSDGLGRLVSVLELSGDCPSPAYWGYTCGGSYNTPWGVYATSYYSYSPLDLLTQVQDAKGNLTSISYDTMGRKTQMTDPDMGTWYYTYDINGNLTRQRDARGQRICFAYDAMDRLTGKHFNGTSDTCPGTPTSVTFGYDSGSYAGGKRSSMGANGQSVSYVYDSRSRLLQVNHTVTGLSGVRSFSWGYDSADRVTSMSYPATSNLAAETATYTYDPAWRQASVCSSLGGCYAQSATYDALNQPTRFTFGNNLQQNWSYSSPMQRLGQLRIGTSASLGSMFDRSYSYDAGGNVASINDNRTSQPQLFRYDFRDRLTSASAINTTSTSITIRARGDYSDGWPIMRLTINGVMVREWTVSSTAYADYTYTHSANVGPTDTVDVSFVNDYGNAGTDRNLHVDYIKVGTQTIQAESRSVSYDRGVVDGRDVLATEGSLWWDGALRFTQQYAFDQIGNLTTKEGMGFAYGSTGGGTGTGPHQARTVGGSAYSYDLSGNLLSGDGRSYSWTAENLPATVASGGVTESYGYDGESGRFKKERSGTTTYYLQGSWEETSTGAIKRYYTLNGQTVAVRDRAAGAGSTTTISYLHGDHLGSTSLATNSSAAVASQQEYDPWGKVRLGWWQVAPYSNGALPISQTSRAYTGQIQDDTGLLFYNARYYDPGIARFISGDSVVPGNASGSMDGVAVKPLTVDFHESGFLSGLAKENRQEEEDVSSTGPQNAQALNRYSYVQNNPLKYTDLTGHYVSYDVSQAQAAWEMLTNMRTRMDTEGSDFDANSAAEDFLVAVMGLTRFAAKASLLLAPLAEFLDFAANDGSSDERKVLDYLITELGGFINKWNLEMNLAQNIADPKERQAAIDKLMDTRISFWFTEKHLGPFDTRYTLHSSWGGLEGERRESLSVIIGGREVERRRFGAMLKLIGFERWGGGCGAGCK